MTKKYKYNYCCFVCDVLPSVRIRKKLSLSSIVTASFFLFAVQCGNLRKNQDCKEVFPQDTHHHFFRAATGPYL